MKIYQRGIVIPWNQGNGLTINAALDPDIPVLVARCAISGIEVAGVGLHICLNITFMVLINGTSNGGPRIFYHKETFHIIAFKFLGASKAIFLKVIRKRHILFQWLVLELRAQFRKTVRSPNPA